MVPHNRRPQFTHSQYCFHIAKIHFFSVTAKSTIRANGNGADEYRRRHASIDIAVALVGFLLVGGKGRDTGGVGGLDDGIKVIIDGFVGFIAEVGQVEGNAGGSPLNAGHELADLHLELDGIDEDHIVEVGMIGSDVGLELKLHMQAIDMAIGKIHAGYRAGGENQAGIVDMNRAVGVGEALLVDAGELVVLDMPVGVGHLGEATLDDGAEDGGGVLHGLEERTLPQLCLRPVVSERRSLAAAELLAEAGIVDTVADGTGLLNDGWSYLCHSIGITTKGI